MGSMPYDVEISDEGDSLTAFCGCPHFARGYLCKHLYAAILAADAQLKTEGPSAPPKAAESDFHWKRLLFSSALEKESNPWEGAPGSFMLRYELEIGKEAPILSVIKQNVLKSGGLGKQRSFAPLRILEDKTLPRRDRFILEMLQAEQYTSILHGRFWQSMESTNHFRNVHLSVTGIQLLFPELALTGRCKCSIFGEETADPLRLGQPYEGSLEFILDHASLKKSREYIEYEPSVHLGADILPLADIRFLFLFDPPLFILNGALHKIAGCDSERMFLLRRAENRVRVPKNEVRDLFAETERDSGASGRLELPEEFAPSVLPSLVPKPCLEVAFGEEGVSTQLWLDYEGLEIPCDDPRECMLDTERWTKTMRNAEAERAFREQLLELGFQPSGETDQTPGETGSVWALLDRLFPLTEQGWTIRGRDKRTLRQGAVATLRVTSGQDWFDLEGGVDFGGVVVPLPKAIRAFLRGERTIDLADGSQGVLPEEWLRQHARALDMGLSRKSGDGTLRFHSAHALLLDNLLLECSEQAWDANFTELRRRMLAFAGVEPPAPPAGLRGELRPYQREALGWFDFLKAFGFGGILADDMGLGKTIQALAWLLLEKERGVTGPTLVVAPTSLLFNWREEAARFCPDLAVLTYAGLDRKGLEESMPAHDLVLTTYGLLRRDIQILMDVPWRCLILDESQAIKNPDSQTAKAARILNAEWRLCMTGTPLENRLDELWSQFQFSNPNLLGSRAAFDERFAKPVAAGETEARATLQRLVRPFVLRRAKEAVASELPEKQEAVVRCEMTPAQAKVYARLRDHYRGEILAAVDEQGLSRTRIKVLEGLLRLRQTACSPALVGEPDVPSGKLEELIRVVGEVVEEGHKVLIFSQFTRFLALIRDRLRAANVPHAYLDGRTPAKTREQRVASFQDPAGPPVFCISLKAGGVGLNLTAADYVFIMDPWWNPATEAQAVDRAHRIGQDKKVFAYRFICQDSIDEKVLALQEEKRELASILDGGTTSSVTSLTREDLEALFS